MSLAAFYELAFQSGAFQEEAATVEWAFQQCAFQADAFQADLCNDEAQIPSGAGSSNQKKKHRRIHPREIWEETEQVTEQLTVQVKPKRLQIRGSYADFPNFTEADLDYAIAKLEAIVNEDYEEDDVEALLLML